VGQDSWLFLTGESEAGLRSTIGLGQGRFRVERGEDGKAVVVNDRNNAGLFRGVRSKGFLKAMDASGVGADTYGPIGEEEFVRLVIMFSK